METTQMRFKDLLVADLGPLPADATINEDLNQLNTKVICRYFRILCRRRYMV